MGAIQWAVASRHDAGNRVPVHSGFLHDGRLCGCFHGRAEDQQLGFPLLKAAPAAAEGTLWRPDGAEESFNHEVREEEAVELMLELELPTEE